jgi:hypothetical protein
VPDDIGTGVRIRVEDSTNPSTVFDESDVTFDIKGKLTLTSPNATTDNIFLVGNNKKITWTAAGTGPTMTNNLTIVLDTGSGYLTTGLTGNLNGATNGSINPAAGEVT